MNKRLFFVTTLGFTLFGSMAWAEETASIFQIKTGSDLILVLLLAVLIMVAAVLLVSTLYLFMVMKQSLRLKESPEKQEELANRTFWERALQLKPLSAESGMLMEHGYDGIRELNNPTPPWFMYLFYSTIVFGVVYLVYYHIIGDGQTMTTEYAQEIALADEAHEAYMKKFANAVNESNVTQLADKKAITEGKTKYDQLCVACHGAQGQGGVGPNLTDAYWLHGGTIKDLFKTVSEGVPAKGMISWKSQLNPIQIQQVTSYILTLQGTNPPGAKEPQGEKMQQGTTADSTAKAGVAMK